MRTGRNPAGVLQVKGTLDAKVLAEDVIERRLGKIGHLVEELVARVGALIRVGIRVRRYRRARMKIRGFVGAHIEKQRILNHDIALFGRLNRGGVRDFNAHAMMSDDDAMGHEGARALLDMRGALDISVFLAADQGIIIDLDIGERCGAMVFLEPTDLQGVIAHRILLNRQKLCRAMPAGVDIEGVVSRPREQDMADIDRAAEDLQVIVIALMDVYIIDGGPGAAASESEPVEGVIALDKTAAKLDAHKIGRAS